ncbi:hypothetical protein B0H13DRAFT_1990934 [Mycena leptocephala]|nr:hypothetical protein B0H13DRAFT_1990934 [Mycena leptocephala]
MTPVAPPLSSPCANWSLLPFDLIPGLSWPPTVVPLSNLSIFRLFSKFSLAEASAERLHAPLQTDLEKPHEETASPGSEIRKRDEAPSPIHSIPPEIVSLIFEFTLPPFVPSYGLASVQNGPWVLSAVCSRWRYIALSQPSLWTTIFLDFTDEDWDAPSFELIQPKLAAYLARSKQLPLNITFAGPSMLYYRLDGIRGKLPVLRALDIRVRQEHCAPASGPLDVFESCPRLQKASVNAGRYDGDRPIAVKLPEGVILR